MDPMWLHQEDVSVRRIGGYWMCGKPSRQNRVGGKMKIDEGRVVLMQER